MYKSDEGIRLVSTVNHTNIKLLADLYHMRIESEAMESVINAGSMLKHLHIANYKGRTYPRNFDEDDYQSFFNALKKISYNERISIEARTENFNADAPAALKLLKAFTK